MCGGACVCVSSFCAHSCDHSWFHGDVSPPEAIELLQGHPEGTFLIRFRYSSPLPLLSTTARSCCCSLTSTRACAACIEIRYSSQPGCFAASFMASHSEVRHALIQGLPQGGFLFAGEKETFPNLTTLIEAYSPTLRYDNTHTQPHTRTR